MNGLGTFCGQTEAHFTLHGAVNSQNCRIWGIARIYVVYERSFHSDYICVWPCFEADFIPSPFFFEQSTSQGPQRCSITSSRYFYLLQQKVIHTLHQRQCLETMCKMLHHLTLHDKWLHCFGLTLEMNVLFHEGFLTAWSPPSPNIPVTSGSGNFLKIMSTEET